MKNDLPPYARRLNALHRALTDDFRGILTKVPIPRNAAVLDVGCGDGYYTRLLVERGGAATGLDNSDAFLKLARAHDAQSNTSFILGDARQMPFADGSVDVLWSGHSMQSYPDIAHCLAEFRRVLKPDGVLAVLETDNVHSVMLSWPPDLELAIRQAEHREIADEDSYAGTYFPRFASRMFEQSGFTNFETHYFFIHRRGPAEEALCEFVTLYLEHMLEATEGTLSNHMKKRLALLGDNKTGKYLPRQPDFFFGSLQVLMLAR